MRAILAAAAASLHGLSPQQSNCGSGSVFRVPKSYHRDTTDTDVLNCVHMRIINRHVVFQGLDAQHTRII